LTSPEPDRKPVPNTTEDDRYKTSLTPFHLTSNSGMEKTRLFLISWFLVDKKPWLYLVLFWFNVGFLLMVMV
jgi:hypothetical protein